jgi:hypothetical protein
MVSGAICPDPLLPELDRGLKLLELPALPLFRLNKPLPAPSGLPEPDFVDPSDCRPSRTDEAAPSANHMAKLRNGRRLARRKKLAPQLRNTRASAKPLICPGISLCC